MSSIRKSQRCRRTETR